MTNKRTSPKPKKQSQRKARTRVHALTGLTKLFGLIRKFVLRKIGKGRVKTPVGKIGSKACACRTCTPCKGLRPVDPIPSAGKPVPSTPVSSNKVKS